MIHHQHFFPVVDDEGKLKPAFLAVVNMEPEKPEVIARNAERVLAARLRDARFFWDEDRKTTLEARIPRLATILFHKKLGSYREKADRVAALANWIAREALEQPENVAQQAELAGRLCKADLATDMVRELTELQGTMGGIYAREEGLPEEVWKAIYFHYLPIGVEADAPPSRQQLGRAAIPWAAVSLADKLDSIAGMFTAGERPTGSRDPLGLRRQAQGVVKILADLPELTGLTCAAAHRSAVESRDRTVSETPATRRRCCLSWRIDWRTCSNSADTTCAACAPFSMATSRKSVPLEARLKLEALAQMSGSQALLGVAALLKRVKNITKGVSDGANWTAIEGRLVEPAERTLWSQVDASAPGIRGAAARGDYREAFAGIAALQPPVAKFFDDVMVMTDDQTLRQARLALVAALRDLILGIADLSEIATDM